MSKHGLSKRREQNEIENLDSFISGVSTFVNKVMKDEALKKEKEAKRQKQLRIKEKNIKAKKSTAPKRLGTSKSTSALIMQAPASDSASDAEHEQDRLPQLLRNVAWEESKSPARSLNNFAISDQSLPGLKRNRNSLLQQKLLNSPYKSSGRSISAFGVKDTIRKAEVLNKFFNNKDVPFHSIRSTDAVEKRNCNACWAKPAKATGCEHGHTSMAHKIQSTLELQGPTSYDISDLLEKYRNEQNREKVWRASIQLQEEARQRELETGLQQAVAVIDRHPIYTKYFFTLDNENVTTRTLARQRNMHKEYVLSVHRVWQTNLDHVNYNEDTTIKSEHGLRGRLDMMAIKDGHSQLQSVSTERAVSSIPDISLVADEDLEESLHEQEMLEAVKKAKALREALKEKHDNFIPLSVEVCGRKDLVGVVPGTAPIGKRGLWWSCPLEIQEYTQPAAMFLRDENLNSSKTVVVLLCLALDVPLLAPFNFAWFPAPTNPPAEVPSSIRPSIPSIVCPKMSILASPIRTELDNVLPSTLSVMNEFAEESDYQGATSVQVDGHRRIDPERDDHYFRQHMLIALLEPLFQHPSLSFGITESAARPNKTGTHSRFIWHSIQRCVEELCAVRRSKDYLYIIINRLSRGANDPNCFLVGLHHEAVRSVTTHALSEYLANEAKRLEEEQRQKERLEIETKIEAGRLALEAKRLEQQRLEKEIAANDSTKAASLMGSSKISTSTLEEWDERVRNSKLTNEWELWEERVDNNTGVTFYHLKNEGVAQQNQWEPPEGWPYLENSDSDNEDQDDSNSVESDNYSQVESARDKSTSGRSEKLKTEIAELVEALAQDEKFLEKLKEKLGLETNIANTKKGYCSDSGSSIVSDSDLEEDEAEMLSELDALRKQSLVPKLANATSKLSKSRPGEGWRRLKSSSIPKDFAQRIYKTTVETPSSDFMNKPNTPSVVGMLDPADSENYILPISVPALRAQFVADVTADAERMARGLQKDGNEKGFQQGYEDFEKEKQDTEDMAEKSAQALVYARNSNLERLEAMLDEHVDVNHADENGNTLFIIACQQGNKRIAKFLMRRKANVDAQNFSGNTGLHYCFEYKNTDLGDYLLSKGAKDSIVNAEGLTCYEGLSQESLDSL